MRVRISCIRPRVVSSGSNKYDMVYEGTDWLYPAQGSVKWF